ncbi:Putative epoxidase LasC [Thermoflexales bacterium]|nr:Putative epoxidase LasC [Thermoflexales bacterium]
MNAKQHAIVIGGSIAGMLAARVLSDHFERVTIIDRDALPDSPEPRRGAPQTAHVHVLLRRGLLIMQQLFPQLEAELTQAGALSVNWTRDLVTFTPAGWSPRFDSEYTTRTCSRGLLEQLIRRQVAALKNITTIARCEALEPLVTETRSAFTGLKMHDRDRSENAVVELTADLIVDASGRTSKGLDWIARLGYAAPEETVINAHVGYATRAYRRPANFSADWKSMMVRTRPPFGLCGGLIYPIENNLWMVNLAGAGAERPPTDEASFLDFTRTFIHPALYHAVKDAEPISAMHTYQRTENRLRHFDRLTRWPENFVMLGDAACAFNPTYGQGMSVAALEAQALEGWLRTSRTTLAFQRQLMKVVRGPWLMATNEDSRLPHVEGATNSRVDRIAQRYLDEFIWLCGRDPQALEVFMGVSQLMKPATALFAPTLAFKVLRRMARHEQPQGTARDPIPILKTAAG